MPNSKVKRVTISLLAVSLSLLSASVLTTTAQAQTSYSAGVKCFESKNYKTALVLFVKALKENPRDGKAAYSAALCAHHLGNKSQAIALYKRTLLVAPGTTMAANAKNVLAKLDPTYVASLQAPASASGQSRAVIGAMTGHKENSSSSSGQSRSSSRSSSEDSRDTSRDYLPSQARVYFKSETGRDTRMIVDGRVNGRSMKMLFDTGAPAAGYFSLSHLKELGLPLPDRRKAGKIGGSSNTQKVDCWEYNVDMQVGTIKRKSIPILVLDNKRDTPLLGQEFWKGYTYTIDYGGKSIHFTRQNTNSGYSASGRYSVPFKFRAQGNRVIVDMEINGKKFPVMFDTGHTTDAVLSLSGRQQARLMGISIPDNAQVTTTIGASGSGTSRIAYARKVKLGPIERYDARVHVSDEEKGAKELPLLGQAFYRGWQYTIDMEHKLIHFKRR